MLATLAATAFAACGDDTSETGGVDDAPHEAGPATCFAPEGVTARPQTIADVVALLNALPKPVSVGCLLQVLERPLAITASTDQGSFQPAYGKANPRILIDLGGLLLTVVPKGAGSHVIELGERREGARSTKAELPFPVVGEVLPADPFIRVLDSAVATKCSVCHTGETRDPSIDVASAFMSAELTPLPRYVVSVEELRDQYARCDPESDPERCEIFDGLFGYGEVVAVTE